MGMGEVEIDCGLCWPDLAIIVSFNVLIFLHISLAKSQKFLCSQLHSALLLKNLCRLELR